MAELFTREYWNREAGEKWAASHGRLDRLMQPYADVLLERAELASGQRVVDVGCGAGAVARAAARICGPGRVHGVDVSVPLLSQARLLAEEAELEVGFVEEDACHWTPDSAVDRVVSRFGVMFFEDPRRAFRNIRSWLAPGGRFVAVCWQARELNPWITEPLAALAAHVERTEETNDGPGPHSLAECAHVENLLSAAGFEHVELEDLTITARLDGDPDELYAFHLGWGPTSRIYQGAPESKRPEIESDLRRFVDSRHDGGGMEFVGRVWLVEAA